MTETTGQRYPPRLAQIHPNSRIIKTSQLKMTFDNGRLSTMEFLGGFNWDIPLKPYCEAWKNLEPIGELRIRYGMERREVLNYISAWEKEAAALGATKVRFGDLSARQYAITEDQDEIWDMVGISMGVSRRAGGGGIWTDGWHFDFITERESKGSPLLTGRLHCLSAFCDEFNTTARRK